MNQSNTTSSSNAMGTLVSSHLPCWACGSSDGASIFQDKNNEDRYYGICFAERDDKERSCTREFSESEALEYISTHAGASGTKGSRTSASSYVVSVLPNLPAPSREIRKIPLDTLFTYGVKVAYNDENKVRAHYYPLFDLDEDGAPRLCAYKIRYPKKADGSKSFSFLKTYEEAHRKTGFFGQFCEGFPRSKSVMITEGELDAMSAYTMLRTKMPVVSLNKGAGDTSLNTLQKEFLDKFTTVYLCFDSDSAGQKAARRFSQSFPPEKIRVVNLSSAAKDSNEYLQKGLIEQFNFDVQNAKSVVREGIVLGRDTQKYLTEEPETLIPYGWDALNDMVYGVSDAGELITILSGSGLGKSTVMKAMGLHWFDTTDWKIGCLFLEENKKKTVKILTGMEMEKNLLIPEVEYSSEHRDRAWGRLFNNDRWVLWDHWGSNTIDSVIDTVRYMVSNFGAKVILLDHITIVLSGGTHGGDERKAIDELMTKLRSLVNELEFVCVAISHLKKNDGVPHEEGGRVKMSDARGSGSIYQLSDTIIGLERDGQSENPAERNITNLRVLKSRLSGETGPAGRLLYNKKKGVLRELDEESYKKLLEVKDKDTLDMETEGVLEEFEDVFE